MRKRSVVLCVLICAACMIPLYHFAYGPPTRNDVYFYKESDYYTIKLAKTVSKADWHIPLRSLTLDHLVHSYVCPDNPLHIEYEYEKIYADVIKWLYAPQAPVSALFIGGGGYTFPRYMELSYPNARIDVAEIDPEVTKVACQYLGVPANTRIRTSNVDGRWFVMNCKEQYDVIFTDAFNDLSIPYHLTTREFVQQLKGIMRDKGILMSNIIDNFQKGAFLPSYIRTLQDVFGEKNVYLLSVSPDFDNIHISTFIVIASKERLDMEAFDRWLGEKPHGTTKSVLVSEELFNRVLARQKALVLTDDYAPVDNLIAPIFEERFGYSRKR